LYAWRTGNRFAGPRPDPPAKENSMKQQSPVRRRLVRALSLPALAPLLATAPGARAAD